MALVRVQDNVEWKVLEGQSGAWVSVCEPLQLTVQGDTYAELLEDIGHTLDAVLRDLKQGEEGV
jgi:predicted RNase H-like HicB family nuclease